MHCAVFLCADIPKAGRVNISLMDEQTLMEMLIADLPQENMPRSPEGSLLAIQKWGFLTFGDDGNVVMLEFPKNWTGGSNWKTNECGERHVKMNFRWIPAYVERFKLVRYGVQGTVDTHQLPRTLRSFVVQGNLLSGAFDVHGLPETLVRLDVSQNLLQGSLDLRALPERLTVLHAWENHFSGSADFTGLPTSLRMLNVCHNGFSGVFKAVNLPGDLRLFSAHWNKFLDAEAVVDDMPEILQILQLDRSLEGNVFTKNGEPNEDARILFYG